MLHGRIARRTAAAVGLVNDGYAVVAIRITIEELERIIS